MKISLADLHVLLETAIDSTRINIVNRSLFTYTAEQRLAAVNAVIAKMQDVEVEAEVSK